MTAASIQLPAIVEGGLSQYIAQVNRFPMLEEAEEVRLANAWRDNEDIDAAHKLVTSHLRLVVKIAMGFRGYGLPISDLIAEGNIGLMQAVKRFDPDKGFRLSTYAMWWIKAAINEYILRSWSLVKMGTTAAQKKLFFNLRRLRSQITGTEDRRLTPAEIKQVAHELDVPDRDVIEMDQRLGTTDASLNAPVGAEDDGARWIDYLEDEGFNQEVIIAESEEIIQRRKMLERAMKHLNERERHIIEMRQLRENPMTLEALSQEYGISRERVRQIEARAMEKLRESVENATVDA